MTTKNLTALEIKQIRQKYGLSQQAFAQLLGIGEASIARYENGREPTRANANLIRAAAQPEFMYDCLERDGDALSEAQFDKTSKIVYSMISFNEKGEAMDINERYMITLEQEILNEKAARLLADLHRSIDAALGEGDEALARFLEVVSMDIAKMKPTIATERNSTMEKVAELRGQLMALEEVARNAARKVA